jgi:hypothetical protein
MLKGFARTLGVFCLTLGLSYGAIKLFSAPPKLIFLTPALTLVYLSGEVIAATLRPSRQRRRDI